MQRSRRRWSAFNLVLFAASHIAVTLGASRSEDLWNPTNLQSLNICEARAINYITHSLPEICLKTPYSTRGSTPPDALDSDEAEPTPDASHSTHREDRQGQADSTTPTAPSATTAAEGVKDEALKEELSTEPFMSFEEWKEMMLRKTGQDPTQLRTRKTSEGRGEAEASVAHGELDSLGDDEIVLDFDALPDKAAEAGSSVADATTDVGQEGAESPVLYDYGKTQYYLSKDAGKTCKERFSYSSFDAGATVLKTSPGAKNAKAILVENKDTYMLLECAAENKYVIVELSDDILVDTVVIANFEFFSSMVRHFRLSVSDRYPVKMEKWKVLGDFETRNSRDIQPFLVENPLIWAKYVRVEFLTHWGNEYYCPLSLLRIHGTRMLESWKDSEAARDDEEGDDGTTPGLLDSEVQDVAGQERFDDDQHHPGSSSPAPSSGTALPTATTMTESMETPSTTPIFAEMQATCPADFWSTSGDQDATLGQHEKVQMALSGSTALEHHTAAQVSQGSSSTSAISAAPASVATAYVANDTPAASTVAPGATDNVRAVSNTTSSAVESPSGTVQPKSTSASSVSSRSKPSGTSSSAASSPTIQESFFKTVTKRLQLLESNTTMSVKYIEDQFRVLRDTLAKIESKQNSKVESFLDSLNRTAFAELRALRQQYDEIWQSTVITLESSREQSRREVLALSARLTILADEVVFQKRMAILQSVVLLSCLALVIFSRGLSSTALVGSMYRFPSESLPPRETGQSRGVSEQGRRSSSRDADNGHNSGDNAAMARRPSPSLSNKTLPLTPASEFAGRHGPVEGSASPPAHITPLSPILGSFANIELDVPQELPRGDLVSTSLINMNIPHVVESIAEELDEDVDGRGPHVVSTR